VSQVVSPNANASPGAGNVVTNAYDGAALSYQTGGPSGRVMNYGYDTVAPPAGTPSTSTTTITDQDGEGVTFSV